MIEIPKAKKNSLPCLVAELLVKRIAEASKDGRTPYGAVDAYNLALLLSFLAKIRLEAIGLEELFKTEQTLGTFMNKEVRIAIVRHPEDMSDLGFYQKILGDAIKILSIIHNSGFLDECEFNH